MSLIITDLQKQSKLEGKLCTKKPWWRMCPYCALQALTDIAGWGERVCIADDCEKKYPNI